MGNVHSYDNKILDLPGQIDGLEREITFRERKFPELVKQGRMDSKFADYQIRLLRAVLQTLRDLDNGERQLARRA